ncbi:envelope integrity protein Cei [Actinokineospora auranticolor]|uniref:LytR cell envelope-related transcriptional attenuator n=1 Tax=Actinokineospora auranticolor TaxID=155976 RepID=A0A2S6GHF4_9PSEU|nr:envelope integrity protein Cei [Actinokineospora auranticolor]PPK64639.1 LytR cell envelope-related transcriptional attenuator [Actinokineospora auranticolor]
MSAGIQRAQRYRRRRPLPAVVLMAVLAVVTGVVWLRVIQSDSTGADNLACPAAQPQAPVDGKPAPLPPGQVQPADALDRTPLAPAGEGLVRVLNAGGQRGLAGSVTETLRDLGFTQISDATTDSLYPGGTLACRAQIRFGQGGMSVARTLSVLEPCAEFVKDERKDATVDLAIGKDFDHLQPTPEARRVLERLTEWAQSNPGGGGLQTDGVAPQIDESLIKAARATRCS